MNPPTTIRANQHVLSTHKHVLTNTPDYEKSGFIVVGLMLTLFRKPLNSPPNGESQSPTHSL